MKTSRPLQYLLLAVAGLFIGQALPTLLPSKPPQPIFTVGSDLRSAQLSLRGHYLAGIGCRDGSWFVQVWDQNEKEVLAPQSLPTPPGRFHALSWSPDGKDLAVAAGDEVWIFKIKTGEKRILAAGPQVRTVEYNGQYLLAHTRTSSVIWKGDFSKPYWRLDQNRLLLSALDGNSERLATSCFEDGVRVFDLKRKRQTAHFKPGWISAGLKFGDGGRLLTVGYRNPSNRRQDHVITYDLNHGVPYGPALSTPSLYGLDTSLKGQRVVTRQFSGAVTWDVKTGTVLSERPGSSRLLDVIDYPGDLVCSELEGNTAALWNAEDSSREHLLTCPEPISDMRFTHFNGLILVGGQARVWKL